VATQSALRPTLLGFGLVALALLLAGEKLLPGRPVALAVVVLAIFRWIR
jgi:hypothetical protein